MSAILTGLAPRYSEFIAHRTKYFYFCFEISQHIPFIPLSPQTVSKLKQSRDNTFLSQRCDQLNLRVFDKTVIVLRIDGLNVVLLKDLFRDLTGSRFYYFHYQYFIYETSMFLYLYVNIWSAFTVTWRILFARGLTMQSWLLLFRVEFVHYLPIHFSSMK